MPTSPTPLPAIPPFPALADKATGTYNSKAYDWATGWADDIAPAIEALADNAYDNAVEAQASASAAATSASTATTQAGTATTQASAASASAAAAAASAATAVNAPGTSGTSTTSTTVGAGTKTLTTQTGKAWVVGQQVTLARTSDPAATRMWGAISAYNSGSGSISIVVGDGDFTGTGTHTDWTIGLSGQEGPAGADAEFTQPWAARSGAFTFVQGDNGGAYALTTATAGFDTPAALDNGWSAILYGAGGTSTLNATFADGSTSKTLTQGRYAYLSCNGSAVHLAYFGAADKRFGARGAATVFASHDIQTRRVRVARLTDTLAVAAYENTSNHPVVVALSISGSTVTAGTPVTVEATGMSGNDMELMPLTASTFALAWSSGGGTARVAAGSVSGTTVTMGSPINFYASGAPTTLAAVALSATKLAIFFSTASVYLHACTVDISGTTCTANAAQSIYDANTITWVRAAAFSATKCLLAYNNGGGAASVVQAVDISGSSFAPGTSRSFSGAHGIPTQLAALSSSRALLYRSWAQGALTGADLRTIDVSGTALTMGPVLPVANQPDGKPAIARISDVQTLLLADAGNVGYMAPYALDIQDALPVITAAGNTLTSYVGGTPMADLCILNATQALVVYRDTANSNYGTARVLGLGTIV